VWFANLFDQGKQSILVVDQNPQSSRRLNPVTSGNAAAPTLPFPVPLYNDGFENRPAVHLKAYDKGQLQVFESNFRTVGDIVLVNPAVPNSSSANACINTAQNSACATAAPVEALEYAVRANGDGVLLAARGTTLRMICDSALTNLGVACRAASFDVNLGSTATYPNTDGNGTTYIAGMDRIYSIAVDRSRGNLFVELGTATQTQIVVIEDASLSANHAVVRNVFDVQTEHVLSHGNLKAVYTDRGGRLAVSRNGILTRVGVSATAPGGVPTFFSGQIP
jgi:hypothetical protein